MSSNNDESWEPPPEIPVDPLTSLPGPQPDGFLDFGESFQFVVDWDRCRPWFAARGYTLYPIREWRWCLPPFTGPEYASPPYATCVRKDANFVDSRDVRGPPYRILWAQDAMNRDVALKMIKPNSDEYRIYETLLRHAERVGYGRCVGVLLPLAILDTPFNYAFVVMPRWGDLRQLTRINRVKDALRFMRCTLEGLTLLHSYRIVHRDISDHNMLVDCYTPDSQFEDSRRIVDDHIRTTGAQYCIFDFNGSAQFPPDTPLRECIRPADEAGIAISPYVGMDAWRGEHVYNPFANDVACLGNIYRVHLSRVVTAVPMLAPLLDKMTTHISLDRFTAEESLIFFDAILSHLSDDLQNTTVSLEYDHERDATPGAYWAWTPPGFNNLWRHYETRPWSWGVRALDRICQWPIGWRTVRYVRSVLRK